MFKIIRIGLATARLSRLVTSDKVGDWLIVRPVHSWAMHREGTQEFEDGTIWAEDGELLRGGPVVDEDAGWRSKLVSGLECPFCVGFWIGAGVLAADAVLPESGPVRRLYDLGTGALALNYVIGHVSAELD